MPSPSTKARWIREPGTRIKWPVFEQIKTNADGTVLKIWISADDECWNYDFSIVKHHTLTNCKAWRDRLEIDRITI
jgi:hypothetical protein